VFASGALTVGIGAVIVGASKFSKIGKANKILSVVGRLRVLDYRQANALEKVGKILLDWFKLAGARALAKLKGQDALFAHKGEMLEAFLGSISRDWDGVALGQLERLINRWATTQPPPAEAVLDIVSTIAKYGKQLGDQGPVATVRIVQQLDRFGEDATDVVRQLVALDKGYAASGNFAGMTRVNLDWLARNMEAGRFGADTDVAEGLSRFTRINVDEDDAVGPNSTLFRLAELWRTTGTDPDVRLVSKVKSVLANKDIVDRLRLFGGDLTTDFALPPDIDGFAHFLDVRFLPSVDVLLPAHVLSNGRAVPAQVMLKAGELAAVETKAFRATSWDSGTNMNRAVDEVLRGFRHVDPDEASVGASLIAVTPDLLQDQDRLLRVLMSLNESGVDAYDGRCAIVLLSKDEAAFRADAFGLLRSLQP
jgi:hypothetical protein